MKEAHNIEYITINPNDRQWGMVVNSVGYQSKGVKADHPAGLHPKKYMFTKKGGRVLPEFQLLYLTRGHGVFFCESLGRDNPIRVKEGDMFLLFPREWHSYYADDDSPWDEFWIGFEGIIPSEWVSKELLSTTHPIFHIGLKDNVISTYERALQVSKTQKAGYQQLLASLTFSLIAMAVYYDRNNDNPEGTNDFITKAKIIISEEIATIAPESLAQKVGVGYSKFRKIFRNYTGFSPGQYIYEIKILKAKELLDTTNMSVKSIAIELGFDADYFVTAFKNKTGLKPSEYRQKSLFRTKHVSSI